MQPKTAQPDHPNEMTLQNNC